MSSKEARRGALKKVALCTDERKMTALSTIILIAYI